MDNTLFNLKASSLLLSTNVKLTTNIKIIADSNNNIYLESFDANQELSNIKFKKYQVSPNSLYNKDIYNFYNKGQFPKSFAYENFKLNKEAKVLNNFSQQFDMFYKYGAYRLISKLYDEQIALFAPLYLNEYIPKYFIIFKCDTPFYNDFNKDVIKKSTIIKTFDLTENSNLGKYIRNYATQIPNCPFIFNSKKDSLSYINGIDYNSGNIIKKGISIYNDYINTDKTVIENDNYITKLFENNSMILANLLNLEFIFDDSFEDNYEINRYFGLYVDDIEYGTFNLDIQKFNNKQNLNLNTQIITNQNGCLLYTQNNTFDLPIFNEIKDKNSFYYIKDINSNFYKLNNNYSWNTNELRITNTKFNLNVLNSETNDIFYIDAKDEKSKNNSHVVFEIVANIPHAFGIQFFDNLNNLICEIYSDENLQISQQNDIDFYFCGKSKLLNIAKSIVKAINNQKSQISAKNFNNSVIIYSNYGGSKFNNMTFKYVTHFSNTESFIKNLNLTNNFIGGTNPNYYRFLISKTNYNLIQDRYVATENGFEMPEFSFVIDDEIKFKNYYVLTTKNKPLYYNAQIKFVKQFNTSFGIFSIYPIKDFDYNFYSTEYDKQIEFKNEEIYYTESSKDFLIRLKEIYVNLYTSIDNQIKLNIISFLELKLNENLNLIISLDTFYECINMYLNNQDYTTINLFEYTRNIDVNKFYNEFKLYELDNNEINEYNIFKENYNSDFSDISKVNPYICKWNYKNGLDCKNRNYRLNSCSTFGMLNGSSSNIDVEQKINYNTLEWFNIVGIPEYYTNKDKNVLYTYIDFDPFLLNSDYFLNNNTDFFTTICKNNFSIFQLGDNNNFSETFFKGNKFLIKERFETSNLNFNINTIKYNNTFFNDYKFSILLINQRLYKDNKIEIIKNEKYKYVIILIYVNIDYSKYLDKTLLYSLKNKYNLDNYLLNGNISEITLQNIKMIGSLDLESSRYNNEFYIIKGGMDSFNNNTKFVEQLFLNKDGKYFNIEFDFKGDVYRIIDIFNVINNNLFYAKLFTKNNIPITNFPILTPNKKDLINLNYDTNLSQNGYVLIEGGFETYKKIIERITYASVLKEVNNGNPNIIYKTIKTDGSIINNNFILTFNNTEVITKPIYIESTIDKNKPTIFNFVNIIGYKIKMQDNIYVAPFLRHNGYYEPKFINLFEFIDNINTEISNINNIKNYHFNKVTDSTQKILELENNNNFKSLYPLINEFYLDKTDFNIFKTNWDENYYFNYYTKKDYKNIKLYTEFDTKNYFGSKLIKTPNEILIELNNNYSYSINSNIISINIDLANNLIDYLKDKLLYLFSSLEDYKKYVLNNIYVLYDIEKINFYYKKVFNTNIANFTYMNKTDYIKQNNGLILNDSYKLRKDIYNKLNFIIDFSRTNGESYEFAISVLIKNI